MRRPLTLICTAALALSGLGAVGTAGAAPAPPASPKSVPGIAPASAAVPQSVPGELVVGYVVGASAVNRERGRERASARVAKRLVAAAAGRKQVELVRLPQGKNRDQAVAELRSDPAVAYAEPNYVYSHQATSTDPIFKSTNVTQDLWGMYGDASTPVNAFGSQAAEAWAAKAGVAGHTGSKSVYVGVIDEGIQFTHPDLDANVWTNPSDAAGDGVDNDSNGYVDDVHGWDFANNDNSIFDGSPAVPLDNHGTHVSGTIGAEANNGVGGVGEGVVGVNWDVTLISGKFLGAAGGTLANAVKALDYFTELKTLHGVNIVATNNSWSGGGFSQALLDAIRRADAANILFVAAAGNSATNNDRRASYPSNYNVPNVIAVAAIDRGGNRASFSSYGAKTVDLGAPGVGVWSTTASSPYSTYNGTSMATPHVTGAAALWASTHSGATAAQIKKAILDAAFATPTSSLTGKTVTGGRLNLSGF